MLVKKDSPSYSYGMPCQHLNIPEGAAGGMTCLLEPGKQSVFHRHHETEIFVIVKGKGQLIVDEEVSEFQAGDCIYLRPFVGHALRNLSDDTPVEFVALYWEGANPQPVKQPLPKRVLIFSTPPTPNGDLHLGHMSGPYLGADIYRRYLAQKGVEAVHITGRDDHQTYVKRIGATEGRTPLEVADDYAARIQATWAQANIPLDYFSSPKDSELYRRELSSVLNKLYDKRYIVAKTVEEFYDVKTGFSLHEGYIKGSCPHCGSSSDGNACEQCGRPNDCIDLLNPQPTLAGVEVGRRTIQKLYFRMSAVQEQLADLVDRSNMSTRARALSLGMLADGLPDICISHQSDWGIPVDIPSFENQVVYVWFEMAAGYLAADRQANKANPYFTDRESRIVHFYGFDNTYYHTLLFPAVYFALGGDLNVPEDHIINELLFLRGEKFSTSRRHLIWANKLLSHVPADYVRWGVSRSRPEMKNENFDLDRFIADTNAFFADRLNDWLLASFKHLATTKKGVLPDPGAWSQQHTAFYERVKQLAASCEGAYQASSFSPQTATRKLEEMVALASEFFATQCRHETHPKQYDYHRTTIALNFWAMAVFARLAMPIVPVTAKQILDALRLEESSAADDADGFIKHKHELSVSALPQFARVTADMTEAVTCVN